MTETRFTWVQTHKEIVNYLLTCEDKQNELIELLKSVGITPFNDKDNSDEHNIELDEIDPFTFFCYIYKYGNQRRLKYLQDIAKKLNISIPMDESGLPSAQAQKVWLFPYKTERINNEVHRLWAFFKKAVNNNIENADFEDVLQIKSTGKTKLTEALFYVNPEKYLPINGPTKPFLKDVLGIDSRFNSYSEYLELLKQIKNKTSEPFYEISYNAWKWNNEREKVNYWIFQGNPKIYNVINALIDNALTTWSVKAHENNIKIGDKIILWVTGKIPGCYALGEVTSEVYEGFDEQEQMQYYTENDNNELEKRVKISVTHNLSKNPITKEQIEKVDELSDLKVGNQGTNFSATQEEFNALLELTQNRNFMKYWLYAPGKNALKWDEFYEQGIMAIGWDNLGDLNNYKSKDEIVQKLQILESTSGSKKNDATANFDFKNNLSIGDIVIIKSGRNEYLGYGIVASDYYFDRNRITYQKCRKVNWKKKGNWPEPNGDIVLKTLTDISNYTDYVKKLIELIGIEQDSKVNENQFDMEFPLNTIFYGPPGTGKTYNTVLRAAEIIENRKIDSYEEALKIFKSHLHERIEFIAFHHNYSYEDFIQGLRPDIKNNQVLTFERKDGVFKCISDRALENYNSSLKEPEEVSKDVLFDRGLEAFIEKIQESDEDYHIYDSVAYITETTDSAFRYKGENWGGNGQLMKFTDLKELYRNNVKDRKDIKSLTSVSGLANQHASYFLRVFNEIQKFIPEKIEKIEKPKKLNYVIVIDEINRANISRVFGELITLIEPDKRSHGAIPMEATLPSGESFIVPSNLYIIGTMNTADKSIALLDIALRRRFEFEAMYPKYEIPGHVIYDKEILLKINEQIIKSKGHDFQIGHSFFMDSKEEPYNFVKTMNKKVIPLLLEYYMNDKKEVENILTTAGLEIDKDSWPIKIIGKRD